VLHLALLSDRKTEKASGIFQTKGGRLTPAPFLPTSFVG
jgi:hypothetical protein